MKNELVFESFTFEGKDTVGSWINKELFPNNYCKSISFSLLFMFQFMAPEILTK